VRRVEARVEIDHELRRMVFLTNNLEWSPRTPCDLYRRRWDIEVFCPEIAKDALRRSYEYVLQDINLFPETRR
jgi:hypothetical protein